MLPATDLAEDRAASTLELFFDLVFVLAITEVAHSCPALVDRCGLRAVEV